jgi:hypothetical protein
MHKLEVNTTATFHKENDNSENARQNIMEKKEGIARRHKGERGIAKQKGAKEGINQFRKNATLETEKRNNNNNHHSYNKTTASQTKQCKNRLRQTHTKNIKKEKKRRKAQQSLFLRQLLQYTVFKACCAVSRPPWSKLRRTA